MHVETRVLGELFLYGGMFVLCVASLSATKCSVVLRGLAIYFLQEFHPLSVRMALLGFADDLNIQYSEHGE